VLVRRFAKLSNWSRDNPVTGFICFGDPKREEFKGSAASVILGKPEPI